MDSIHSKFYYIDSQTNPTMKTQPQQQIYTPQAQPQAHSSSSQASFSILALAIIGILTTAFLLIGYYIFAIKCCLSTHRIDILSPFFISRSRSRRRQEPLVIYASAAENRGLDESEIRSIPILQFKKTELEVAQRDLFECAVCLNEFQEEEKLRILPICTHVFHIDCIDIWLQNNANCPLCRSSISISSTQTPPNQIITPTSLPNQTPFPNAVISGDQDFVVIEVRNGDNAEQLQQQQPIPRANSEGIPLQPIHHSPRKTDQKTGYRKARKSHHILSMGDECINVRAKDEQFSVQPIRRSISMDSSADRQLFLSIQEIIQQNRHLSEECINEDCSSSSSGGGGSGGSKLRRPFFSFGHGRGSRNAVLPVTVDQENY